MAQALSLLFFFEKSSGATLRREWMDYDETEVVSWICGPFWSSKFRLEVSENLWLNFAPVPLCVYFPSSDLCLWPGEVVGSMLLLLVRPKKRGVTETDQKLLIIWFFLFFFPMEPFNEINPGVFGNWVINSQAVIGDW